VSATRLLMFVDTNKLLDFYRSGNEARMSLLKKLGALHDRTITTCQVEMEFKKNRLGVMKTALDGLQCPNIVTAPSFLSESRAVSAINAKLREAGSRVRPIQHTLRTAMKSPASKDPVFQAVQLLFANPSPSNLRESGNPMHRIRRLAWSRFMRGLPPRKKNDTSIGDALNWEWVIECAAREKADVVIVSRDCDYGVSVGEECIVNDFLAEEFQERVGRKHKVTLTDKLSRAFARMNVRVSPAEARAEAEMATQLRLIRTDMEEYVRVHFSEEKIQEIARLKTEVDAVLASLPAWLTSKPAPAAAQPDPGKTPVTR
jgi:hypothetical protein